LSWQKGELKIFTGNANPELAEEISSYVGVPLGSSKVGRFGDGEIRVQIEESVRGTDVFIIQPTCPPVNENLMELLIMIDAIRRASAKRITAVMPYYGYARQERKSRARDPISAKLVANLITTAGARRVVAMDLHAGAIQGFFDIPVDHLPAVPIFASYYKEKGLNHNCVIVSPDIGGVTRAREMAGYLGGELAIIDKRRSEPGVADIMNIIGDVQGKNVIMVDDMIDSGGTIVKSAVALKNNGAKAVYASATHPVLSGSAVAKINDSPIEELVITNTIPLPAEKKSPKIKVLTVAPLLGEAIVRIHEDLSVSKLFS